MRPIRFGTEGWRAVLAEEYTFDNVRAVARAAAHWFQKLPRQGPVAVGHDTRFMGDRFASAAADELAVLGVEPRISNGPVPTPAVCYYVAEHELAGAVVLTASHNSAEYNGFKVKSGFGASVEAEDAAWIGREANRLVESGPREPAPAAAHEHFDVKEEYLERLLSLVDRDMIAKAKLRVVADCMHGSGGGYFDEALRRAGCAEVKAVRVTPDATFGWKHPEPIGPNLEASMPLTADPDVDVGLATDGDADRLGMMADGDFIDIQRTIAVVLYHLLKNRGWRGRVVRAINVTSMVDKLCERYGCDVTEASVGFKNIAPEMVTSEDVMLGVEESGGFGIRGHIPDRDGTLAALVACEALAVEGKPLRDVLQDTFQQAGGRLFFGRLDLRLSHTQRDRIDEVLPSLEPAELAGMRVDSVNRLDGAKFVRGDGSWVLIRLSGTEPLVRIYAEARGEPDVKALIEAGQQLIKDAAGG